MLPISRFLRRFLFDTPASVLVFAPASAPTHSTSPSLSAACQSARMADSTAAGKKSKTSPKSSDGNGNGNGSDSVTKEKSGKRKKDRVRPPPVWLNTILTAAYLACMNSDTRARTASILERPPTDVM
jgi:hypothetical protein